jgi:hypothetical protein
MKVQYINSSNGIKNYENSVIAKGETNDCVVRAFASAFEIDYDEAHNIVETIFKRKPKKGTFNFSSIMGLLGQNGRKFNNKGITKITHEYNTMMYYAKVKGEKVLRNTTTSYFLKKYSVGTYIVIVTGHAFTIKDGVVIGNYSDAKKTRKHILGAWKIG